MSRPIGLNEVQERELEALARHAGSAYVRLKALAVLAVGRGELRTVVARVLGVERRSVGMWVRQYLQEGPSAFGVRKGRGRKPRVQSEEVAAYLRQAPSQFGIPRTRWTLGTLASTVPSLKGMSASGVWKALRRLGYGHKRGQPRVHSPDTRYQEKKEAVDRGVQEARSSGHRIVLLFQDEASFYRQPTQGWLWAWMGRRQPRVRYGHRSNTRARVVAFIDAVTGRVVWWDMGRVTVRNLARCLRQVANTFRQAEKIYLAWDNWPVHQHPQVQAALEADPRIHVLPLPTYAPWLNPIEKLWRLVRQEVTHAHPWCDDFRTLLATIREKLSEFAAGSPRLLQYCGLSV